MNPGMPLHYEQAAVWAPCMAYRIKKIINQAKKKKKSYNYLKT